MGTNTPLFPYRSYGLNDLPHLVAAGLYGLDDPVDVQTSPTGRIHAAGAGRCVHTADPATLTAAVLRVRDILNSHRDAGVCPCSNETARAMSEYGARLHFLSWAIPGQLRRTRIGDTSSPRAGSAQVAWLRQMSTIGRPGRGSATPVDPIDVLTNKVCDGLAREADRLTGTAGYRSTRAKKLVDGAQSWLYFTELRESAHGQHRRLCELSDSLDVGVTLGQILAVRNDAPGRVRLADQVTTRSVWVYVSGTLGDAHEDLAPLTWAEDLTTTNHGTLVKVPLALAYTFPVTSYRVALLDHGYDAATVRTAARLSTDPTQVGATAAALKVAAT